MKKIITSVILLLCFAQCKKKDTSTPPTSVDPCKGNNLCFMLDGTQKSQNAKWTVIAGTNPRNRISWEEGTGSAYKNIEIDIYGDSTGTYQIAASPAKGQAGFQYYETAGAVNIQGQSGTLIVTKNDGTSLSGTFKADAKDGAKTHTITEGNFVKVAK